uniref:Uncharacterized protein n=1 Tax=Anguilla anguilla TaxID=7936 RepID=A0A0E9TE15_ANGAN
MGGLQKKKYEGAPLQTTSPGTKLARRR